MANAIESYPSKLATEKPILYLGNIIRMQEEISTGGAGFRFMYAAFLQEAGKLLAKPELIQISNDLTAAGDIWRNFAYQSGKVCKNRHAELMSFKELAELLRSERQRESNLDKIPGQLSI